MKLAVLKESAANETRVAISPETVKDFRKLGIDIEVEKNAGKLSAFTDKDYINAGAKIFTNIERTLKDSSIILTVKAPQCSHIKHMKEGSIIIGMLADNQSSISEFAEQRISSFAMEYIPRITRTQNMDALSSQSNLSGYKAVIDAVAEFERTIPMMITSAGTIKPAKILILGAGVAGLQAIATAKRIGAIVSAFDVRSATKEQVESLGAKFLEIDDITNEDAETNTGYAKEMSSQHKQKQEAYIHKIIKEQDIVICTALTAGKAAPTLITNQMVKSMKNGSVIVDLATPAGGNCTASVKDKITKVSGVKIMGHSNVAGRLPADASALYARNVLNFVVPMLNIKLDKIKIDFEDEVIQSCLLTHEGIIVHPSLKKESN